MFKRLFDISMEITKDTIVYPGDTKIVFTEDNSISKGDTCNTWSMSFGSHMGTHVDAPKHFCEDGLTIDQLTPDFFVGKAKVYEVKNRKYIGAEDISEFDIQKNDIILLKTSNSELPTIGEFNTDFVYITAEAAVYLAEKGIKTLGFDYLSIEKYGSKSNDAHNTLLGNNIAVIEGLRLKNIEPGIYDIIALPINLLNGNGSPVRAFLSK